MPVPVLTQTYATRHWRQGDFDQLEAAGRAWGHDLGPDETPFEAGLMFAVKLDKATPFIGRDALWRALGQPSKKKPPRGVFDDPAGLPQGRRGGRCRWRDSGRTQPGGVEPEGRRVCRPGPCARRGGTGDAQRHARQHRPLGPRLWRPRLGPRAFMIPAWPRLNFCA